jgi:chromosome segregation ATPase
VVLWDVQTGERAGEVGNEFDQVLGADLSPDQQHVALGGPGKTLKIYSTKDGKLEKTIKKHTDWITAVAYSPDGKFLASADRNGGISVWEGATGLEFNNLPGHKTAVTALAFMPGVLASASEDGKITLWDVKEGKESRSWAAHAGGASSVDFTTDGRLVSAGRDKLAKAWDQNGKVLLTSQPFPDIALRAVLAEDRIIAGDWTGSIRVFALNGGGKPAGELTSNPPSIAENLTAAGKTVNDLKAGQAADDQALADAEAKLKAAWQEAHQKHKEALSVAMKAADQAKQEFEAAKAAPSPEAIEELKVVTAELDAAKQARAAAPEAEREEAGRKVMQAERRLGKAQERVQSRLAALEKKAQEAVAGIDAAQRAEVRIPPAPDVTQKLKDLHKKFEDLKAEHGRLLAQRGRTDGDPKKREERLATRAKEMAAAEAAFNQARDSAKLSPIEQEVARLKAEKDKHKDRLEAAVAAVQRWQRAQAFMLVHQAKRSVAELQARHEDLVVTARDALLPIADTEAALASAQKTVTESPALIATKEAESAAASAAAEQAAKTAADSSTALAEKESRRKAAAQRIDILTTDITAITKRQMTARGRVERKDQILNGIQKESPEHIARVERLAFAEKELVSCEAELATANQGIADAKKEVETLTPEIAKIKESADPLTLAAKKATKAKAEAEAALKAAREAKVAAEKVIADLKPRTSEIAAAAQAAKATAEKEAILVTQQLETAKAEAARIRTEYEAKFPAAPSAQPIAAK